MTKKLARTLLGAVILACSSTGCGLYRDLVDVSYPERYECESRQAVTAAVSVQAENGHVLDQTVWNAYFDPGTDRLTLAGARTMQYLGRRRPMPDTVIYLQQANDLPMDVANPEAMAEARTKLDLARAKVVERFLLAQTGLQFEVVMPHNPAVPSMSGQEAATIHQNIIGSARGTMTAPAGGASGGAGAGGASSGGSSGGTSGGGR
jgi:uncharacterized membrane protein YgcG